MNKLYQVNPQLKRNLFWTSKTTHEQVDEIQQRIGDEKVKEWLAASYLVTAANTPLKSKQIINSATYTANIEISKESRELAQQSFANLARINHALNDGNISQQIGIISTGSKSYWMYPAMDGLQEKHQKTDDDLKYLYNQIIEKKFRYWVSCIVRFMFYTSQSAMRMYKILLGENIVSWNTINTFILKVLEKYQLDSSNKIIAKITQFQPVLDSWKKLIEFSKSKQKNLFVRLYLDGRPMKGTYNNSNIQFAAAPLINGLASQTPALITPLAIFGGKEDYISFKTHLHPFF